MLLGCPEDEPEATTGDTTTTGAETTGTDGGTGDTTDTDTTGTETTGTETTGTETTGTDTTGTDTTGTDTTGTEGGTEGGTTGVVDDPSCTAYCAAVISSCGEGDSETAQYATEADCVTYCEGWAQLPMGTVDDVDTNTVGCRMYHADVASESAEQAAIHCVHAGPTGGNVCGTWCDNYCDLAETNCAGDNAVFDDDAACMDSCSNQVDDAAAGATAGDSVQCRIYHLGVAGSDGDTSAGIHCAHGAEDGGGVCAAPEPTCAEYCSAVTTSCAGDNLQFADEAACNAYCDTWGAIPAGTLDDTSGNTIGCRLYHAGVAAGSDDDAAVHCPHAGGSGGEVCGTLCENYCHLSMANCDGQFADNDACMAACGDYPADADLSATDGDSVQCRIYHLGVAGSDKPDSAGVHCAHGDVDGGGVCVVPAPTCAEYCSAVTAACTGDNLQFIDGDACNAYCDTWGGLPAGTAADTAGNTVGCRLYHAGVASGSPEDAAIHCTHAGPTGDGVCGTFCDNYCHLAQANCTGGNELYADNDACMTACDFPEDSPLGSTAGDSIQCRIYHLGVAGSDQPDSGGVHCPHAAVDGGGVCAEPDPTCAQYCDTVTAMCTGDNAQYADITACMTYCETSGQLPIGTAADTSGNTLGCRTYHANVAGSDIAGGSDAVHCPHAGPTGAGVCGTWCDNYCHLATTNCTGANELYADTAACMTACGDFPDDGALGDVDGGTVQCKIYHLGVAGTDGDTSAGVHCPHAGVDGGGVCFTPDTTGNTCAEAAAIGAVPFSGTGNTDQPWFSDNNDCPSGPFGGVGDGDNDYHYSFNPDVTGIYTVTLTADFDASLYELATCSDTASCGEADDNIGDGGEELELSLTAGTTVWIVIDGWGGGTAGTFTLDVSAPCVATCAENACNVDDGCGGTCACSGDDSCNTDTNTCGVPACAQFCTAVMASCTGDFVQFGSEAACLAHCETSAGWMSGDFGDTSGNSIACRTYHAGVAGSDPGTSEAIHCAHAGPSGGGVCGSWCENYCQLDGKNCGPDNYADEATCLATCDGFVSDTEDANATSGDSVQCRIYHAGVAGTDGATSGATHCPHAGVFGGGDGGPCTNAAPNCETYCTAAVSACGSEYDDMDACMAYCGTWAMLPSGSNADVSGNTVGCRTYHARVAASTASPQVHCGHAGQTGGDVCGSYCTNYCHLSQANCVGGNELYVDSDACTTSCALMEQGGTPGDTAGDSVQCRMYHLGVAGSDAGTSEAVHCPHGGSDGGGVCTGDLPDYTGNECLIPFTGNALPFSQTGNTSDAVFTNNFSCDGGLGNGAQDNVIEFTLTETTNVLMSLTADFDSGLFVQSACAGPDTCLDSDDDVGDGGESIEMVLEANVTYYIVVDGWSSNAGTYTLDITGACVPSCTDKVCGDDGCGGTCGECNGMACQEGVCVDPSTIDGNTCVAPILVDALPYSDASTTSGMTNDFVCPGGFSDLGNGVDVVYEFTAAVDGDHTMAITAGFDTALFVLSDCADTDSCIDSDDSVGDGGEELTLAFTAGTTYYIVVDAYFASGAGTFTLDITGPDAPAAPVFADVQPIFSAKCSGCHTGGGSGGHNIGTDLASAQNMAGHASCSGLTEAECTIVRIKSGQMPLGAGCSGDPATDAGNSSCLTQEEQDLVQAWVDTGATE